MSRRNFISRAVRQTASWRGKTAERDCNSCMARQIFYSRVRHFRRPRDAFSGDFGPRCRAPAKRDTQPMPAPIHARVVIIGSGRAGYTAAIYAARAMLEPILIQGIQPGGQLTITTDVENYPGFADVIQGPWRMEHMEKQAAHVGTKIVTHLVTKHELAPRPFRITSNICDVYPAE